MIKKRQKCGDYSGFWVMNPPIAVLDLDVVATSSPVWWQAATSLLARCGMFIFCAMNCL